MYLLGPASSGAFVIREGLTCFIGYGGIGNHDF